MAAIWFAGISCETLLDDARAATEVRSEPGGTRFMVVDGLDVLLAPGGARLLFIDENTIRTGPGAPHVLYLDGDNVRSEPGGPRVAYFDGNTLRRSPGGPILLVIDGKDVRKEAGGPRVLYLDGDALSRSQLAAALYQWNPALFKLSPAELEKLKQEADAASSASSQAARDKLLGKFTIINSNIAFLAKGTCEIAKQGNYFSVNMDFQNGQKWTGTAIARQAFKEQELWTAVGPTAGTILGVYEAQDEIVKGEWIPQAAMKDGASALGAETLEGAPVFNGNYTITSGKHILNRGGYSGTVRMSIFPTLKNDSFSPRLLEYQIGNSRVTGIGAIIPYGLERQALVAAVSTDKIFAVGRISEDTTSGVHLDFCTNTKVSGYILLDK
ncbi:MAG: hypothetical protein C0483_02075 [Pirellula sp.]|nr:hypothetical protein [Pirellula sp.]